MISPSSSPPSLVLEQAANFCADLLQPHGERSRQLQDCAAKFQAAIAVAKRQLCQGQTIQRITTAIHSTLVLEDVLELTVNQLHETLQVDRCLIFRADPNRQMQAQHVSEATIERQSLLGIYCDFYEHYHHTLSQGCPVVISQLTDGHPLQVHQAAVVCNIQSILIMPLMYQNIFIGGISLHHCTQSHSWTEDEVEFVRTIANHCAIAIHQAELHEQLSAELAERKRVEEELKLLQVITQAIAAAPHLNAALEIALRHICLATDWVYGEAWIPQAFPDILLPGPTWYADPSLDEFRQFSQQLSFAPGEGLPGRVWVAQQPEWNQDVSSSLSNSAFPRTEIAARAGLKAALSIPITVEGNVLVVLVFFMLKPQEEDLRLVKLGLTIATQLGTIIQHKQAEAALATSEIRFRSLVQNSSDVISILDRKGNRRFTSPSVERVLGYTPAQLLGRSVFEQVHPNDLATAHATFFQLLQQPDQLVNIEVQFRHANGHWIWLECTGSNLLDEPAIEGIVVNVRDISDRKHAEIALRNLVEGTATVTGQDFFPALVRHLAEALDVRYALVAEAVEDQLNTLAIWADQQTQPNFSFPIEHTPCQIVMEQGSYRCAMHVQQQFPHNTRLVEMQAESYLGVVLSNTVGDPIGTLCIIDDQPFIDLPRAQAILHVFAARAAAELERKRATEALQHLNQELEGRVDQRTVDLRNSEQRFRTSVENMLDAFAIFSSIRNESGEIQDFQFEYVNQAACISNHMTKAEILGKRLCDLLPTHRTTGLFNEYCQVVETGRPLVKESLTYEDQFGHAQLKRAFAVQATQLDDGFAVTWRDVTERKLAEVALRQRIERERLLVAIAQRIRQSLELEEILNTTVAEVQQLLLADRVVIYRFNPDWSGVVVVEAVKSPELSILGKNVQDPCFTDAIITRYQLGRIRSIEDVETAGLQPCHLEFLKDLSVRATLIVPILQGQQASAPVKLWGLLIVQQCFAPRQWQPWEAELLRQLATQVAIAIQQSELYKKIKGSLEEKELLLREVHHRVKNNMQVISSIFSLQSQTSQDPRILSILTDSKNRIRSMAMIHEQLYQADSLAKIDLADYIRNLARDLFASYNISRSLIRLNLNIANIWLSLDTAIPCGLLINELVSNSLKHAFPEQRFGEIRISLLTLPEKQVQLIVQDNGIGISESLDFEASHSLGLRLIRALTRQLEGTIEVCSNNGTTFQITFPQTETC